MKLIQQIQALASQYLEEVVAIRRHLHQNPELSFNEVKTSEFIAGKLTEYGIPYKSGYVKTGLAGMIKGELPSGTCIALRADMDALPIEEKSNLSYRSNQPGIMHACGHDAHMASLLGCAKILHALKSQFGGTIILVFQPGEEKLPGGAKLMLEEGLFSDQQPAMMLGLHVLPNLEAGSVGFRPGMYMASSDELYIKVKGKGGHAAMPQDIVDPVVISAHIILALQQIVSRMATPTLPSVLSIGKVIANGATNVIPEEVNMEGTFRTLNEDWRAEAHLRMKQMAENIATGMGGSCEFTILKGYPALINHPELTDQALGFAREFLHPEKVKELDIRMTSEDFAWFAQKYPAVFFRLGVMNREQKIDAALHTPTFNIDEQALATGMGTMAYLAISFINSKPHV